MGLNPWPTDVAIRRKMQLHKTPLDRYTVRIARNVEDYEDAFRLVDLAFAYEGIRPVRDIFMRITPQHVLPEATVLVAYEGDQLVGTMTVTLDSPAGLPLDHDYPNELVALRQKGAKLVEYGSLAIVGRCQKTGVSTLLSMAAVWLSRNVLAASDVVIGINPAAIAFYHGLYGFEPIGKERAHAELVAPVQGMVSPVARMIETLALEPEPMKDGLCVHEHYAYRLPECVTIEAVEHGDGSSPRVVRDGSDWARWKMSRDVFRELFVRRSDRLRTLDNTTRRHLESSRTKNTFEVDIDRPSDGASGPSDGASGPDLVKMSRAAS
jgi:hypothetical protein